MIPAGLENSGYYSFPSLVQDITSRCVHKFLVLRLRYLDDEDNWLYLKTTRSEAFRNWYRFCLPNYAFPWLNERSTYATTHTTTPI